MFVLPLTRSSHALAHRAVAPQLARALDRLFDDSSDRYFGGGGADGARTPALDVTETDTSYTLTFDIPGASREQLKVAVEGRRVSVETDDAAQPAAETANGSDAKPRVLYRERRAARYARTVSLPAEVDQSAAQARFDNGVLTLTLPKKVATGATRISVS